MLKTQFYPKFSILLIFIKNIISSLTLTLFKPLMLISSFYFEISPLFFDYILTIFNFFENIVIISIFMFILSSTILLKNSILVNFNRGGLFSSNSKVFLSTKNNISSLSLYLKFSKLFKEL